MIKLIVGLGNPGTKYENTRHNVGFLTADNIADHFNIERWANDPRFLARVAKIRSDNHQITLAKPETFMNLSGDAVVKLCEYFDIKPEEVLVIADDINLNPETIRVRKGGSDGGHKGLKSIIEKIGDDFWRLRIGVGHNDKEPAEKYVLKNISANEKTIINNTIDKASGFVVESIGKELKESTTNRNTN